MNYWFDLILHSDFGVARTDPEVVLFTLLLSFAIGQFVGWLYMWTHNTMSYSQTFTVSLVVIPVIVSLMMMLMANSSVVAFGLLAVFAVVRFRNVLKDTRDTTFILFVIVEGMAVGTRSYSSAIIGAAAIGTLIVYLRVTSFGQRQQYDAVLSLMVSGDASVGQSTLKSILQRYTVKTHLTNERKISDTGHSMSYLLLLRDPSRTGELQEELNDTGCLDQVSLYLRENESEV